MHQQTQPRVSIALTSVKRHLSSQDPRIWASAPHPFFKTLSVVEIRVELSESELKEKWLLKETLKREIELCEFNFRSSKGHHQKMIDDDPRYMDSPAFSQVFIKEWPVQEETINQKKVQLRNVDGVFTNYYTERPNNFESHIYLIQYDYTTIPTRPNLLAFLEPSTNLWVNDTSILDAIPQNEIVGIYDIPPKTFWEVNEKQDGLIPTQKDDYIFCISDKVYTADVDSTNEPVKFFGKTSFLNMFQINVLLSGRTSDVILYEHNPLRPWMGSDQATREIIGYQVDKIDKSIKYTKLCLEHLQEPLKRRRERIDILEGQKQAKQNLKNKLLELTEIEDIENITDCINMAIDHITKANVSEPVVLEITTQTSRNYWETHLLPIKKRLMNDFDVKDDEFDLFKSLRGDTTKQVTTKVPEQMLKYGQIDTFNGYRLGTINENRKVYQLLLIQVIQGKITLLSKLSGSLLSEPRHICNNNTWKNLTVREESANSIYTLPKFLSYFGSTSQPNRGQNSQLEYYFTLNNDRTGNSNTGTFYGKTSLMPQLRIAREFVKSRTNIVQTLDNPRAIQKLKLGIMNCKIMIMVLDEHHSNTQRVMKVTGQSSHQERANAERCIHIVDTLRALETLQRDFISRK